MNKNWILTLAFAMVSGSLSSAQSAYPDSPEAARDASLPPMIRVAFRTKPLKDAYTPDFGVNPFYVQGDFDGDKRLDVAVLIAERASKKRGIAVIHASGAVSVLGAGRAVGNGGDNFDWLDAWYTMPKGMIGQGAEQGAPPKLKGDALHVEKVGSASALIFWDGSAYRWYQQGD